MAELTKEWLLKTIAELEEERDATPGAVNEDATMALAAMKLALASLEARSRKLFTCSACGAEGLDEPLESKCHCNEDGAHWIESVVYTAPPALMLPEEMPKGLAGQIVSLLAHNIGDKFLAQKIWNVCRAAMLQGADQAPVKQPSSNSVLGWLRADYQDDNRGLRGNAPLFVLGKKDPSTVWGLDYIPLTSNSPVIQDGWVACSERMPEGMTDVHISNGHDVGQGWWDGDTWQTQHDYYSVPGEVTHWQPLPSPPVK